MLLIHIVRRVVLHVVLRVDREQQHNDRTSSAPHTTNMSTKLLLLAVSILLPLCAHATVGKSTYAMTHPFAYKAWMEKYIPYSKPKSPAAVAFTHAHSVPCS